MLYATLGILLRLEGLVFFGYFLWAYFLHFPLVSASLGFLHYRIFNSIAETSFSKQFLQVIYDYYGYDISNIGLTFVILFATV